MMVKNVSNQGGANSVTAAPWWLALGFSMDLRLNTTRRSINLSVYLVFDLEAGRFKFLGENLLGAGQA